jgi:hypothetical protein
VVFSRLGPAAADIANWEQTLAVKFPAEFNVCHALFKGHPLSLTEGYAQRLAGDQSKWFKLSSDAKETLVPSIAFKAPSFAPARLLVTTLHPHPHIFFTLTYSIYIYIYVYNTNFFLSSVNALRKKNCYQIPHSIIVYCFNHYAYMNTCSQVRLDQALQHGFPEERKNLIAALTTQFYWKTRAAYKKKTEALNLGATHAEKQLQNALGGDNNAIKAKLAQAVPSHANIQHEQFFTTEKLFYLLVSLKF